MFIQPSMLSLPHEIIIENEAGQTFDEAGSIIDRLTDRFRARAFVDAASSGREGNVIPNGKAENTYSFLVLTPSDERIRETSKIRFKEKALHVEWISDNGALMSVYCVEVIR